MFKKIFDKNVDDFTENQDEYSIHSKKAKRTKAYKRAVVVMVVLALLMFGAGMKYARYVDGKPLGDVAVAGNIVATDSFANPKASTDFVVMIEGSVDKVGYFSISADTTLRELIDYAGVTADGDIGDFDFNHKPQTGDTYYVKNKNNPVDVRPWLTNETVVEENTDSGVVTDKININTATLEELKTLDGIGDTKGQAIIDYREKNGGFNRIEDILAVKGIGDKTYANLKDYITVE